MTPKVLKAKTPLDSILASIDISGFSDQQLVAEVRAFMVAESRSGEIASQARSAEPSELSRYAVAKFIRELVRTDKKLHATQVRRVEEGRGALNPTVRNALISKLQAALNRDSDALHHFKEDLEVHFVTDRAVGAIWEMLRTVLKDAWKRSFTISSRTGGHFFEPNFASRVCRTMYDLAPHRAPEPCFRYDASMSQLALRRFLDPAAGDSSGFSVSRCPAGFTAFGFPWSAAKSMKLSSGQKTAPASASEGGTSLLFELVRGFQLVFHVGEGYIGEIDNPADEVKSAPLAKVNDAFDKFWGWARDDDNGPEVVATSLIELQGAFGLDQKSEQWDEQRESQYRSATRHFMTTPSPVARLRAGVTPDSEFLKDYKQSFLKRDQVLEIQSLFLQEISLLPTKGAPKDVAPSNIDTFASSGYPLQRIIEKTANLALTTWLRAHAWHSAVGGVLERILEESEMQS